MKTKTISDHQARQLQKRIMEWASLEARLLTTQQEPDAFTFACSGCWSVFKKRFRLKVYRDLPDNKFTEAINFIETQIKRCGELLRSSQPRSPATHNHIPVVAPPTLLPQATLNQLLNKLFKSIQLQDEIRTALSTLAYDRDQLHPSASHNITTDNFDKLPF